jgi:hypothetical protein
LAPAACGGGGCCCCCCCRCLPGGCLLLWSWCGKREACSLLRHLLRHWLVLNMPLLLLSTSCLCRRVNQLILWLVLLLPWLLGSWRVLLTSSLWLMLHDAAWLMLLRRLHGLSCSDTSSGEHRC